LLWLISDARNDAPNDTGLETALRHLPRGSGFIYRHYHLGDPERWERFRALRRVAKACGHTVILSDSAIPAKEWGADGIYGSPRSLWPRREGSPPSSPPIRTRAARPWARRVFDCSLSIRAPPSSHLAGWQNTIRVPSNGLAGPPLMDSA